MPNRPKISCVAPAFTATTGWRREEAIGRTEADLGLCGSGPARDELARLLNQSGRLQAADVKLKTKAGRTSDHVLSAETVVIHGEQCVLAVMLDITNRKQSETELLAAIDAVMQDTSWWGQRVVEKLASLTLHGTRDSTGPKVNDLTPRAREVLGLTAEGLSDDEIGKAIGISRNTVQNHVPAIYRVTEVRKRSALVIWARERGLGTRAKLPVKQRRSRPS